MKFLLIIFLLFSSPCWAGVDCDGVDDLINLGSDTSVDTLNPMSISLWAYVRSAGSNNFGTLLSKATTGWWFQSSDGGGRNNTISFFRRFSGTDINIISSNNALTFNAWHHIAVTWDGTANASGVDIYIDGSEVTYQTTTSGTGSLDSDAADDLKMCSGSGIDFLDGIITDVYLWEADLTSAEIALLASSQVKRLGLQIQPSLLKGYWPLDDDIDGSSSDGVTFVDISSNTNNGTGDDGANNTGLTAKAEEILSY